MLVFNVMMLPGQELREFSVARPETGGGGDGGVQARSRRAGAIGGYAHVGNIKGVLASAKPDEAERWRQLGHTVSHKIIMPGKPDFEVLPGDVFERGARRFYNRMMPNDAGDLGHWTIFYCAERADIGDK